MPQSLLRPFSSPRCLLYFGVHPIALCQGFQIRENITQFPVEALGDVYLKLHEPTAVRVSGSFDSMHVLAASLSSIVDGANGGPLWPYGETEQIIQFSPIPVTVVDTLTGKVVLELKEMSPESRTWSIASGSVMMENGSFVAIRMQEHTEPIIAG